MYLIDKWGIEKFRAEVEQQIGHPLESAAEKTNFFGISATISVSIRRNKLD
jgi:sulfite reductase beta subunit-like hemoprotein